MVNVQSGEKGFFQKKKKKRNTKTLYFKTLGSRVVRTFSKSSFSLYLSCCVFLFVFFEFLVLFLDFVFWFVVFFCF